MKEATARQKEVLDFIADFVRAHTYSPTIREVADHFSISVKGAHDHLTALRKKGLLKQGDKKPRTMELIRSEEEKEDVIEIPILGTVAAGRPILSEENIDGAIRLHRSMIKKDRQYFALKVRGDSMEGAGIMDGDTAVIEQQNVGGDSMEGAGIMDGDTAVIEQQNVVKNGEIAVVMMEDAVTLKTFYRESNRVRLQPENSKYNPIYCSGDLRILGKLAHIVRSYA